MQVRVGFLPMGKSLFM